MGTKNTPGKFDCYGAPDEDDVKRYVEEATAIANMVAVANGEPER